MFYATITAHKLCSVLGWFKACHIIGAINTYLIESRLQCFANIQLYVITALMICGNFFQFGIYGPGHRCVSIGLLCKFNLFVRTVSAIGVAGKGVVDQFVTCLHVYHLSCLIVSKVNLSFIQ